MITTLLQVSMPLVYIALGILVGRRLWQSMREIPAVYGPEPNCGYTYEGHYHHSGCYPVVQEKCGDNFDAGMAATLGFVFWPMAVLIAGGILAITWRTPQTTGEKILALRKAEEELRNATQRMEDLKRS